jgi:transposase
MLHAGLDLSRRKIDVCLLSESGEHVDQLVAPPDADALRTLAGRIDRVYGEPVCAVIESMTGARLVHDKLEQEGWDVEIADAQRVKGLAPLACKTDRIDSWVLAVLSQRDLVPAIWLPDPRIREERELARFRLHLVKHKSALKIAGRELLARLQVPEPWRGDIAASVELIDDLEGQIAAINRKLREGHADHPYIPLLMSAPGIGWVLAFTIAAEIGEIERFPSPDKLAGYTGLCPRVNQSRLRAALPAQQAPARQTARRQSRPGRHRPPAHPRDLAHAYLKPTVRSPRRHWSSGGLTALFGNAPASEASNFA